ncbi:MAG: hypothetical protein JRI68_05985 [Deltaproteobacteria bacterium]|nr:hypothetical protein [Deltaproteobacteria bacterium]
MTALEADSPPPRPWLRRLGRVGLGTLGGAGLGLAYALLGACPGGSCHITSNPGLLVVLGALVGGFAATRTP